MDQYKQTWFTKINEMPKLNYYCKFKKSFQYEKYLDVLENDHTRKTMSCFRLSSHNLEIERGRFLNIARDERHCKVCNMNSVESEYHFLLGCPKYSDLRQRYFKNTYRSWPNIYKFVNLMSTENNSLMRNLGRYLRDAF